MTEKYTWKNERLKPCPFCGGGASVYKTEDGDGLLVWCDDCGGGLGVYDLDAEDQLVDAWNKRVEGLNTRP